MRTKSKWFVKGKERDPSQTATVVAMTLWRLGIQTLRSMRRADYDIVTGPAYFDFLREYLVFLANLADRHVHERLDEEGRMAFMSTLVIRLAEMLAENQSELLGADYAQGRQALVDLFNRRSQDYAHFDFRDGEPDYGFARYVGNQLMDVLPEKDRVWVVEQVISIEAPEAVKTLKSSFANLFATAAPLTPHG